RGDDRIDLLLGLDAGRALLQRHTIDRGAARHAQRLDRFVDAARHDLGGVRVDDQDALGHGPILSFLLLLMENSHSGFSSRGATPMLHRCLSIFAAALLTSGAALAQSNQPPLRTGVDGTFAPHAMPK